MSKNNYNKIVSGLIAGLFAEVRKLHAKFNEQLAAADVMYTAAGRQNTFLPDENDFKTFKDGRAYVDSTVPTMKQIPLCEFQDLLALTTYEMKDSFICREELDEFVESAYAKKRNAWLKRQVKTDSEEIAKKIDRINDAIAMLNEELAAIKGQ